MTLPARRAANLLTCALMLTAEACALGDEPPAYRETGEPNGTEAAPRVEASKEEPGAEAPRAAAEEVVAPALGHGYGVRTFPIPRRGVHVVVTAAPGPECQLRTETRDYDFPANALDPRVSITGKTMCHTAGTEVFCHVSGTGTGLCYDDLDNLANAVRQPATRDGDFIASYLSAHPERRHATISGHSQGAYDASRAADRLGAGDQLFLLQPASSALLPNRALVDALARGATVVVAWSTNDDASIGIRASAGRVPLIELPLQQGLRVHNAPNARDLFLRHFDVPEGWTVSPALDASILSNPGSPHGPWRFPAWRVP